MLTAFHIGLQWLNWFEGMTKLEASIVITRTQKDLTLPVWKGEDREDFLGLAF